MKPPWSNSQLKRLGAALRDQATVPSSLPDYAAVVAWYDELAVRVQGDVQDAVEKSTVRLTGFDLSSRAKTIETLRDKLQREWPLQLPSVQDIAGVRLVSWMSLTHQNDTAAAIAAHFDLGHDAVKDLRTSAHAGYRAVHLWPRLEEGRVEIQVRTSLQNQWANSYEALADLAGRQIRYGGEPDWVSGVPDEFRGTVSEGVPDLAAALRWVSTNLVAGTEVALDAVEQIWAANAELTEEHTSAIRDVVVDLWKRSPLEGPPPQINLDSEEGFEQTHSALLDVEGSVYELLAEMQKRFETVRKDLGRGSR